MRYQLQTRFLLNVNKWFTIPFPPGYLRSGVTVKVTSGQPTYADITSVPENSITIQIIFLSQKSDIYKTRACSFGELVFLSFPYVSLESM